MKTNLSSKDLLKTLKKIETESRRLPTIRNGPRTLDLDILLYGQQIIDEKNLTIPHALILERGFVLQPLSE